MYNKALQSDMGKTICLKICMLQLWMHNQYGGILSLTCPHHLKDSIKGISYMHVYPLLSMIDHGKKATEQFVLHFHEQFRQLDEVTQ